MKLFNRKTIQIIKKIAITIMWCVLVSGLFFCLAFVNNMEEKLVCKKITIKNEPLGIGFFTNESVLNTIENYDGNKLVGKRINEINTAKLEQLLIKQSHIENAKVYSDLSGNIFIKTNQRIPLLRIIRYDGSEYYIDKKGIKMPLSNEFTARVLIANGNIFERYKKEDSLYSYVGEQLYNLATIVDKHAFWKAQIHQIFVTTESEFILVPNIGKHVILFGSAEDAELKLEKLFIFYKEGLNRVGWNKYKSIDLRFKGQVVCKQ